MRARALGVVVWVAGLLVAPAGAWAAPPPQGFQSDADFAVSPATANVFNGSATTQRISCYAPQTLYLDALTPDDGYLDGGGSLCAAPRRPGKSSGHMRRRTQRTRRCA